MRIEAAPHTWGSFFMFFYDWISEILSVAPGKKVWYNNHGLQWKSGD